MGTYLYPPVSVTNLPSLGGATEAKQDAQIAQLDEIISLLGESEFVERLFFPYVGVSDAGYTQLIASTSDEIRRVTWFESGGFPTVVAIGAPGLEVDLLIIPPGGFNGVIPCPIPTGQRVSIKELVSDSIDPASYIVANFLK